MLSAHLLRVAPCSIAYWTLRYQTSFTILLFPATLIDSILGSIIRHTSWVMALDQRTSHCLPPATSSKPSGQVLALNVAQHCASTTTKLKSSIAARFVLDFRLRMCCLYVTQQLELSWQILCGGHIIKTRLLSEISFVVTIDLCHATLNVLNLFVNRIIAKGEEVLISVPISDTLDLLQTVYSPTL